LQAFSIPYFRRDHEYTVIRAAAPGPPERVFAISCDADHK